MPELRESIRRHLAYSLALSLDAITARDLHRALALAVRDQLIDGMLATERRQRQADAKRLYYLSMEFLIGRSLINNLSNLGLLEEARAAAAEYHIDLNDLEQHEIDAALGNGGLGRLAACFLDSLATLDLPGYGYGINYEYGLFKQQIRNGDQVEVPDNWRTHPSPWLIERPQDSVIVPLYGRIEHTRDRQGGYNPMWLDWEMVIGVPHDLPIVGAGGKTVNVLRLFSARAAQEVDLSSFNRGDYLAAVEHQIESETITKVLYPSESSQAGRELRLIQEYFLVACAVRDAVRRFQLDHSNFNAFPQKVAMQLNDTHPTLAIVELMRLLIDEIGLGWDQAWSVTEATFGYTNHTLLPEALERWPVAMFEHVLPRHLQLIYEINRRFLELVAARFPGDVGRTQRMSLIEEGQPKQVRMANLAIVGSHAVNGVARLHSRLVQSDLVPDFHALWPEKFSNKTNGVTPRRWIETANPELASLLTEAVGSGWSRDLDRLRNLERFTDDASFRERFRTIKLHNKERLSGIVREATGVGFDPAAMCDVQVKRIHEYKRQLLNLLHVVYLYLRLIEDRDRPTPRTVLFGGKAAPGYLAAKQIIRLIHDVAKVVNSDSRAQGLLRVVFMPDYRVSLAERIIPAADLSEQVSTAGTEASGTGNMKFSLNGALTIGTLDGANIEIREEVGPENFFLFGLTVDDVIRLKAEGPYRPRVVYDQSEPTRRVLDAFRSNRFCPLSHGRHLWVVEKLLAENEKYLHLADFESYLEAQAAAARLYAEPTDWTKKAILNVARMGKFSSDRTIREYSTEIWKLA